MSICFQVTLRTRSLRYSIVLARWQRPMTPIALHGSRSKWLTFAATSLKSRNSWHNSDDNLSELSIRSEEFHLGISVGSESEGRLFGRRRFLAGRFCWAGFCACGPHSYERSLVAQFACSGISGRVLHGINLANVRCSNSILHCAQEPRSEEHTSELQSHDNLVCRLLLEKKKN